MCFVKYFCLVSVLFSLSVATLYVYCFLLDNQWARRTNSRPNWLAIARTNWVSKKKTVNVFLARYSSETVSTFDPRAGGGQRSGRKENWGIEQVDFRVWRLGWPTIRGIRRCVPSGPRRFGVTSGQREVLRNTLANRQARTLGIVDFVARHHDADRSIIYPGPALVSVHREPPRITRNVPWFPVCTAPPQEFSFRGLSIRRLENGARQRKLAGQFPSDRSHRRKIPPLLPLTRAPLSNWIQAEVSLWWDI